MGGPHPAQRARQRQHAAVHAAAGHRRAAQCLFRMAVCRVHQRGRPGASIHPGLVERRILHIDATGLCRVAPPPLGARGARAVRRIQRERLPEARKQNLGGVRGAAARAGGRWQSVACDRGAGVPQRRALCVRGGQSRAVAAAPLAAVPAAGVRALCGPCEPQGFERRLLVQHGPCAEDEQDAM